MLDMTLGAGIMWGSLFLAISTVIIVWINNGVRSQPTKQNENNSSSKNGFIRRGECDQVFKAVYQSLDDTRKENRNWWEQVAGKIDNVQSNLNEIRKTNEDLGQRVSALEAVQKNFK